MDKPETYTVEIKEFLDDLRDSGTVNMFGAGIPLREAFPDLSRADIHACLAYWMTTFGK